MEDQLSMGEESDAQDGRRGDSDLIAAGRSVDGTASSAGVLGTEIAHRELQRRGSGRGLDRRRKLMDRTATMRRRVLVMTMTAAAGRDVRAHRQARRG